MIRALLVTSFYLVLMPGAALIGFPWTLMTGKVDLLYSMAMWIAKTGLRLGGVRIEVHGLENLDPRQNYIFMSNHVSNLDPPVIIPMLPRRTSVLVKKELFRVPILGTAMRMAALVPVDRKNREAAIASVQAAGEALKSGINMTVFPEGTRSPNRKLLPFKKGPFYLAMDAGVPIAPITIQGTEQMMPKGSFSISPGTATVQFHYPIDPKKFENREQLMEAVRISIESGLSAATRK